MKTQAEVDAAIETAIAQIESTLGKNSAVIVSILRPGLGMQKPSRCLI